VNKEFAIILSVLAMVGCNTHVSPSPTTAVQQEPTPSPTTLKSAWYVQGPEINPIDGVKTQFLSLGANENSKYSRNRIRLVLSFENGKLTHKSVGARLDVDGFVTSDGGAVRLKFDDEKPIRDKWAAADSHDSLFPYGRCDQLLVQLLHHNKLAIEFSYYEKAPQTVTFDLAGLRDDMKAAGLHDPTEGVKPATARAKSP
jgi:hypothetical protein